LNPYKIRIYPYLESNQIISDYGPKLFSPGLKSECIRMNSRINK